MIGPALGALPPPGAGCRITVVIPARNESADIGAALAALGEQLDLAGNRLSRDVFDVIVFANNCSDDTAAVARERAAAARLPAYVVEADLRAADAHIGAARKYVMDLAAARFQAAEMPLGLIASTDSDTVVDRQWIAYTLREARAADAVAGHVAIAPADQARLLAPVRLLYARELSYRRSVAEIEALLDPLPEDPLPRHSAFVGASFAVTARTYIAAGGLPPRRRLEDLHFSYALRRIDARIRHSPFVRATTSARAAARVDGGFGSFIARLHQCAERGETFSVEHPQCTIDRLERRRALRRVWQAGARNSDELAALAERLPHRTPPDWPRLLAGAATFGAFYEDAKALYPQPPRPDVNVEIAIETLRVAAQRHISQRSLARDDARSSSA